jgi:hypothetical protein
MALKYQYTRSAGCTQPVNNQVPILISLSSYYGNVDISMNIAVNGSNFRDYSQIVFSGSTGNIIPTFYSSSLLSFLIPNGTPQGNYTVQVSNGNQLNSTALNFYIDKSIVGPQGATGPAGPPGTDGTTPSFSIGDVTSVDYGTNPSVTITGPTASPILHFVLETGRPGADGASILGSNNIWTNTNTYKYDSTATASYFIIESTGISSTVPITGTNGLTISSGHTSLLDVSMNALTASGLITGTNGLTISSGHTSLLDVSMNALTASGLITGTNGLTISSGHTSLLDVSMNALTASGLITGTNGLTISSGHTSLQDVSMNALTASGLITGTNGLTITGDTSLQVTNTKFISIKGPGENELHLLELSQQASGSIISYIDQSGNIFCAGTAEFADTKVTNLTASASITATGTVQASTFNAQSDYRIKEDIQNLLSTIDKLNPVTYKNTLTGKQDMGFIAHELQEHFPFLVSGEKDGPTNQSVNYIGLIALLTKEIQDLKKEIQELKQRVLTLEEKDAANQTR